ncbi:ADP-ribose pyrophosphatase [Dickeya solani]|nr:ADP-ribose pyrophosphatase [Dickeya solani]
MASSDTHPGTFTKDDVEIIARETLYKGFFSLQRYRFRHRLFNGGMSGEVSREILERGHAVVLLPYDPVRDEVVLIEQIRIAAYDTSTSPWLFELVAGMIEPGESLEEVARREAQEEAGLVVKRCRPALSYLASPGGTSERLAIWVGEVDAGAASGIHGLAEENEDIRVHVVSREQSYQWVEQGIIDNAASVIALQWLALHHETLKKTGWADNEALYPGFPGNDAAKRNQLRAVTPLASP